MRNHPINEAERAKCFVSFKVVRIQLALRNTRNFILLK